MVIFSDKQPLSGGYLNNTYSVRLRKPLTAAGSLLQLSSMHSYKEDNIETDFKKASVESSGEG